MRPDKDGGPSSERTRIRRQPKLAEYDRAAMEAILDEGLVAHVGIVVEGCPVVIPMSYGRWGDGLVLHGAVASRLMAYLKDGCPACVTVTLVDGLVLARSAFNHSMNYRSLVAFGTACLIGDADEKRAALDALVEHLVPGRSADARPANTREAGATTVVAFAMDEASAKVRTGPPDDHIADIDLPVWAGTIPLRVTVGMPVAAPDLPPAMAVPAYVRRYTRRLEWADERPPGEPDDAQPMVGKDGWTDPARLEVLLDRATSA